MDFRLIFSATLKAGATFLMMAHNHPSGQLIPSQAHKVITRKVKTAGELLDITLLDSLIILRNPTTPLLMKAPYRRFFLSTQMSLHPAGRSLLKYSSDLFLKLGGLK